MNRGPKRQAAADKQAKGTYQACRDAPKHLVIKFAAPVMPGYLPKAAQDVWHEEIDRAVQAGIGEPDSSFFAAYCCLEAQHRAAVIAGTPPVTALLTELRRRQEVLGIGGPSSRALLGTPSGPEQGGFDGFPDA